MKRVVSKVARNQKSRKRNALEEYKQVANKKVHAFTQPGTIRHKVIKELENWEIATVAKVAEELNMKYRQVAAVFRSLESYDLVEVKSYKNRNFYIPKNSEIERVLNTYHY